MKSLVPLAAALVLATFASAGAHAATITGLFDTGVDGSGTPLAEGATDTHWVLNGSDSPVVYDNPAYTLTSDARFIAAQADGGYTVNPNTYTLSFDLSGLNAATAQLSGNFEADNYASVYLNDHLIAQDFQGTTTANFQSFTPFSSGASNFVSGVNTLRFVVTDTGPPSAFLVSGLSGTASVAGVPEPATWAMMLLGFGGLGALVRRRRGLFAA